MSVVAKTVLSEVEEVAVQLVERFRSLREENLKLKQQVSELRQDLEVLERDFRGKRDQVKLLEKDRKKTLSRVEKMLTSLAALEKEQE
jgi:cell division protein FtsB